jgi:uncharacterized protein (TIGR03437 family)
MFPADNVWNTPVDTLPVDPNSDRYIATVGSTTFLFPNFGSGLYDGSTIGIPYVLVPGTQPRVPVSFLYTGQSDPGPYPVPPNAPIEGGSDAHVLIVDQDNCILYELYAASPQSNGSWQTGSGAIWDLRSNTLRPQSWTSADAAGLPMLPGLLRYDEIAAGAINHAIRVTLPQTQDNFIWPGLHEASSLTGAQYPPMGTRFRLKASFDISSYSPANQIILTALKKYGMILADNGSAWFLSGVPDNRWDNDDTHLLKQITADNIEAVDESSLMVSDGSGRVAGGSGLVNAGSWDGAFVAPGEIVVLYGPNIGPTTAAGLQVTANGTVMTTLAGVTVTFGGTAAPLLYVSATQINAIVPYGIAGSTSVPVQVTYNGNTVWQQTLKGVAAAPGLFSANSSGRGQVALNQDNTVNSSTNPAAKGSTVSLYATGVGVMKPQVTDGSFTLGTPAQPALPVSVTIGGLAAQVSSAGAAPKNVAGLVQVNVQIPANAPSGQVPVILTVGTAQSRPDALISVK